ncbi:hypothetical protein [Xenococcus sp. PCC 7305]|uniref:hypothetical protein n=1 Tax=Xenococcus sp. PCC 7305 TaxID=102125 RepID=UPI0002D682E9|nr:hypothetical protein [Xenococcus sp. PCC 7305]
MIQACAELNVEPLDAPSAAMNYILVAIAQRWLHLQSSKKFEDDVDRSKLLMEPEV